MNLKGDRDLLTTRLVCAAVTRLSVFWATCQNRILNLVLSALFFVFFFDAGCLSVYHCMKGPPTYCLRSVRTRIRNETTLLALSM